MRNSLSEFNGFLPPSCNHASYIPVISEDYILMECKWNGRKWLSRDV